MKKPYIYCRHARLCCIFFISTVFTLLASCKLLDSAEDVAGNDVFGAESSPPPKTCSSITYSSPSGMQNDITFTFDQAYLCGQFANGDWWVSEGRRGYVQIDSISPNVTDGENGHEVNPSSNSHQGFDKRISGYDKTLTTAFPLQIQGDSSVVKAVSSIAEAQGEPPCRPCLDFAAVLTVTHEPIQDAQMILRPSYFGNEKNFYQLSDFAELRDRQLNVECCRSADLVSFEWIAERYRGLQLDHLQGWVGGYMHPRDNMPHYGASIARDNAVAVLRLVLDDFDIANATHKTALVNYLQMGVDIKGMALNGVNWPPGGGHGNGRKLPLMFAGLLLDEDDFFLAIETASFSEDQQVYWSEVAQRSLFGRQCTDIGYWQQLRTGSGARDCRDPYGYIDGGGHEVGAAYQFCCTAKPWKYTALAVTVLGLEQQWANDAFFSYVERWVNHGAWTQPDPCAPYNGNPADYGRLYGPDANGDCITGGGRHLFIEEQVAHGGNTDGGYYGSKFGDNLWTWYR